VTVQKGGESRDVELAREEEGGECDPKTPHSIDVAVKKWWTGRGKRTQGKEESSRSSPSGCWGEAENVVYREKGVTSRLESPLLAVSVWKGDLREKPALTTNWGKSKKCWKEGPYASHQGCYLSPVKKKTRERLSFPLEKGVIG